MYVFVTKLNPQNPVEPDASLKRINQALQLLDASKQRNQELQQMIDTLLK